MARLPRYAVPSVPQHVIQRGNNRQPIFADEGDYGAYLNWLKDAADQHGLAIHAYVLMANQKRTFYFFGRRYSSEASYPGIRSTGARGRWRKSRMSFSGWPS